MDGQGDPQGATRAAAGVPLIISFGAGAPVYHHAATRLRKECAALGLGHDIRVLDVAPGEDWLDICRRKVGFIRAMLEEHRRPVLWVDVDSRLPRRPDFGFCAGLDLFGLLRNKGYLVGHDPLLNNRLLVVGLIGFGYTAAARAFLALAESIADAATDRVADDWVFEEALRRFGPKLRIALFRPGDVDFGLGSDGTDTSDAFVAFGHSGNVGQFRGTAPQHAPAAVELGRQKSALSEAARAAARDGDRVVAAALYRRILDLDPQDTEAFERVLRIHQRAGDEKRVARMIKHGIAVPALRESAERARFAAAVQAGDETRARRLLDLARREDSPALGWIESRMVRADLDFRAAKLGLTEEDRVRMWWMETPYPGNLGDIVNPYVVEKLSGRPPRFTSKGDGLLAIGSIIKFAGPRSTVWGAGASREESGLDGAARYCAVRGPLTRDLVLRSGGECPDVYGDPAWLLPRRYAPKVDRRYRLGLILHTVHEDIPARLGEGVLRIPVRRCGYGQIEAFIREMLSCEAIVSTSLHGVILAHAYGLPVRLATSTGSSRQISGDGLKFRDYFLSVGREAPEPLDLWPLEEITADLAARCVDAPAAPIDLDRLVASAPFATPGWAAAR